MHIWMVLEICLCIFMSLKISWAVCCVGYIRHLHKFSGNKHVQGQGLTYMHISALNIKARWYRMVAWIGWGIARCIYQTSRRRIN